MPLDLSERHGPGVDVEAAARDLLRGRAVDVFLSLAGAELAERLYAHVERSLSPVTGELTPAGRRRLQVLLERMLDPGQS